MLKYKLLLAMLVLIGLVVTLPQVGHARPAKKGRLLYMTLTKGFHHESVELSKQIVKEIGEKSGAYDTSVTEDVGAFTKENLKNYDAVMFNTTGELPMTDEEKSAFVDFLRSGHGFVGVHSATDTFYMWSTYGDIIGGWFNHHPWHQMVTIDVADPKSPLVSFLGNSFQINDEIYQISDFKAETSHVLLRLDPSPSICRKRACASGITAGRWPGRACSERAGFITTAWAMRTRCGMTNGTRRCS